MPDDSAAEPSKIETEQLLRQMNDNWARALVRSDAETLRQIMAEDFFFAYPFEGDDREEFIGNVSSGDVKVESLSRDHVSIRVWDNTAVLTSKDSARWFYQGHDYSGHYKVMNVYSLRHKAWQLVSVLACPIS
ncbi:MAG: nuclear transport factor 2 family protein [Pyrinomonadaceae bacterium]